MFRFFATFFEKKGGAKKLSIRKFLWCYIVRSGFAIARLGRFYVLHSALGGYIVLVI